MPARPSTDARNGPAAPGAPRSSSPQGDGLDQSPAAKAKRKKWIEYGGAAAAAGAIVLYIHAKSSSGSTTSTNAATESAPAPTTPEPGLVSPAPVPSGSAPEPWGGFQPGGAAATPTPATTAEPPASTTAPSGPNAATEVTPSEAAAAVGSPVPTTVQDQIATSNSGYVGEPVGYSPSNSAVQNQLAEELYANPSSEAAQYAYDRSIGYGPGSSGNGVPS